MEDLKDSLAAKLSAGLLSQTSYDQQLAKIEQSFADTIQTNNNALASEQARLENQEKAGGALVGFGSQLLSAIPIFGEAATSILQSSLSGADQITALVSGIVSELPRITQTIMEALPALIDGFIAALPKIVDSLKSIIPQLINAFVTAIGPIIDGIIELLPVIIDALINALPDVIVAIIDAIPQIIQVLADKIPLLIQVLIQNLPNFIGAIIRALPQIVTSLANMMPMVVISLVTELIKQVPQIILEIIRNIPYVITNLINGLWNGLVQMFTSLVNWINGFLNPFSGDGKFLGLFAKGGEVPPGFQNDSYPARLTSGEIVVDRSTTDKLKGFLDSPLDLSAREGGGDDRTIMLLSKILEKLNSPQKIETSVQFRQQTLADILINLSRTGTRITA